MLYFTNTVRRTCTIHSVFKPFNVVHAGPRIPRVIHKFSFRLINHLHFVSRVGNSGISRPNPRRYNRRLPRRNGFLAKEQRRN
ncbi:hypothetical protein L208DRAFT_1385977, partial [Tricholoma matsutake]